MSLDFKRFKVLYYTRHFRTTESLNHRLDAKEVMLIRSDSTWIYFNDHWRSHHSGVRAWYNMLQSCFHYQTQQYSPACWFVVGLYNALHTEYKRRVWGLTCQIPFDSLEQCQFSLFFGHDFLATIVCDEGSPTSLTLPLAIWEMFFQHWGGRSLDVVNAGCESTRWLQHANFPSVPWKLRHQVWYKQIPKNPSLHLFFLSIQCLCIRFILILIREYKCHRPKSSGASCNTCIPSSSSPLRRDFLIKAFLSPLSCLYFGEGLSFCPL